MVYEPTKWANGVEPFINEEHLNHLESGVAEASTAVEQVGRKTERLEVVPDERVNVEALLDRNRSGVIKDQPYREPTTEESAAVLAGVDRIMRGDVDVDLFEQGFTVTHGWDEVARKSVIVLDAEKGTERCWGTYVFPVEVPVYCILEAPHPVFDGRSDVIAYELWKRSPDGVALFVSGSHRTDPSGDNPRDVAHQPGSMWHKIAERVTGAGVKQIQQHGYGDLSAADFDVIVSEGAAAPSRDIMLLADCVQRAGFRVARGWDGTATTLAGTVNSCGDVAKATGGTFAHIEMNSTARNERAAEYIAAALASGCLDRPGETLLADEFPKPIGSGNSKGAAPTAARADHVHRMTQNDPNEGDLVARKGGGWRAVPVSELGLPAGGYSKPESGIPASDLDAAVTRSLSMVDGATYSATAETLMQRNKSGAVSVAAPTAGVHAANRKYVDDQIAALAAKAGVEWP